MKSTILTRAFAAVLAVCLVEPISAGNKTAVSANGWGAVESSVSYSPPSAPSPTITVASLPAPSDTLHEAKNPPPDGTSGTLQGFKPNAGVNPPSGFTGVITNLPTGCPSSVYCTVTTTYLTGGYKAIVRSYVTGGAIADNSTLEEELPYLAAPNCASYDVVATTLITGPNSGELEITGSGSEGTAVSSSVYEYHYDYPPFDPENPPPAGTTREGPSFTDVAALGAKRGSALVVGPFFYTEDCPLRIPFTFNNASDLQVFTDALAKSSPFEIFCPEGPFVYGCDEKVVYPVPEVVGGCRDVALDYLPPADQLPGGTSTVTVIATDSDGNIATCEFIATRGTVEFHGFYPPINGTGGSCMGPLRFINAGNKIPIKFDATICGQPYSPGQAPEILIYPVDQKTCAVSLIPEVVGVFQEVANVFHFNWNTRPSDKGKYKIVVDLKDGSFENGSYPYAFVELN